MNPYRFVGNDLVAGWDPYGLIDENLWDEGTGRDVGHAPEGVPVLEAATEVLQAKTALSAKH